MEKKPSKFDRVVTSVKKGKNWVDKKAKEIDDKYPGIIDSATGSIGSIKVSGSAAGELGNISKQFAKVKSIAGKGKSKVIDRASKFVRESVTDLKNKDAMRTQMEKSGITKDAIKEEFTSRGKKIGKKIGDIGGERRWKRE